MSDSALKSLEETMRKLETAMKSPNRSGSMITPRRRKRTPPKRKPPTPRKRSLKLTAKEKNDFLNGTGFGSVKSLNETMKFMEKEIKEYRDTLQNVKEILEDDEDVDKCLKIINKII